MKNWLKIGGFIFLANSLACANLDTNSELKQQWNVLVIMVDDLNDNIGVLKGHPQALTPNIDKLAKSGASFLSAYTNAPMCGPSRASMFTGVYPHHSNNYFQAPWFKNEVLNNTNTMMEQFKAAAYNVIGTGKIMHHNKRELWSHFENEADYTPTPFDGEKQVSHPDVPAPFSEIGWVDGSFGPFVDLANRRNTNGQTLSWTTGNKKTGFKPMRYINDNDRDPTPDELNASWTAKKIKELAASDAAQPFFLAVGFLRPHTPLVAPQKYFDRFPLEEIQIAKRKVKDKEDTYLEAAYQGELFTLKMGALMFNSIAESYQDTLLGLKKWTQAYLACVAAVDENIGQVLDALQQSGLDQNTIVVLASDHGFHMGEKDYLYKNSLWEESTRVPLIIRIPGISQRASTINRTVSLIDVYPTLLEVCGLSTSTLKNEQGHPLDGTSLLPLLKMTPTKDQIMPAPALTVVYAGEKHKNNPSSQHYAIRTDRYRYILYNNGSEELYDHKNDPFEWENLAHTQVAILDEMRQNLQKLVAPIQLAGLAKLKNEN